MNKIIIIIIAVFVLMAIVYGLIGLGYWLGYTNGLNSAVSKPTTKTTLLVEDYPGKNEYEKMSNAYTACPPNGCVLIYSEPLISLPKK